MAGTGWKQNKQKQLLACVLCVACYTYVARTVRSQSTSTKPWVTGLRQMGQINYIVMLLSLCVTDNTLLSVLQ